MSRRLIVGVVAAVLAASGALAQESQQEQCCKGKGKGKGQGQGQHQGQMGHMMGDGHREDMELFHYLLDNRDQIRRTVTDIDNGVETVTESDDPEIAAKIREHVRSMESRIVEGRPIHRRDPLFDEIFKHADKIEMTITDTDKGLKVKETSADPYVVKLIQSHARVVTKFIENGRSEMRKNHAVPDRN